MAATHPAVLRALELRQGERFLDLGVGPGLPFPGGAFDAAAAAQVYAYVEDLDMALAELFRVLRPGGRAVVLDTDLDSMVWHAEARERMEQILAVYAQHAAYPNLPRILGPKLRSAGFTVRHRDLVPIFNRNSIPTSSAMAACTS